MMKKDASDLKVNRWIGAYQSPYMGTAPPTSKLACFVLYLKYHQHLFEK